MHIKKIKHSMLCVTGLYLRDINNMIFVIFHLSMSCVSICFSCLEIDMGEHSPVCLTVYA